MATETVKKTKAPAKSKSAAEAKKKAVKAPAKAKTVDVAAATPTYAEIAQLAERYWAERGWQDGYAEQDWLRAERELLGRAS
jgi:hypothetical protein